MELVWETDAYSLWEDTARYIERELGYIAILSKYNNEKHHIAYGIKQARKLHNR